METKIEEKKHVAESLFNIELGIEMIIALIVSACVFCGILICVGVYFKNKSYEKHKTSIHALNCPKMHPLILLKASLYRDSDFTVVPVKLDNKRTIFGNKKVMGLVCHQCGIDGVISKSSPSYSCVKCNYDICSGCYKRNISQVNALTH